MALASRYCNSFVRSVLYLNMIIPRCEPLCKTLNDKLERVLDSYFRETYLTRLNNVKGLVMLVTEMFRRF
jgi:hypothetical protein